MDVAIPQHCSSVTLDARIDKIVQIATLLDDVDDATLDVLLNAARSCTKHVAGPASRCAWSAYHAEHPESLPALVSAPQLCQLSPDALGSGHEEAQ